MPFDETTPLPDLPVPTRDLAAIRGPSLLDTAGAAFRQDNLVGSALTSEGMRRKLDGSFYDIENDYNVFDDIAGYEDHLDAFENVFNRAAAVAVKADIERERRDRQTLAASGWTGFALTAGASILDPTLLLPGGVLAKGARAGYAVGRSALNVGLAAGAATAVQEAGLQATQQTRPIEQSAFGIGGSVILGSLLGAGVSRLMNAAEHRAASAALEAALRPDFHAATNDLHKELHEIAAAPQSVGAATASVDTLDDLSIAGAAASKVAGATAQLNPLLRTLTSPSRAVRDLASSLMDTPVYIKKNLAGRGETAAETAMYEWTRGAVVKALEAQEAAYWTARKAGQSITRADFRAEVGKAMRRGDRSDIPGVSEAAAAWRSTVIEPLKQRAVTAGLLPADVSVSTADSYFSRLWKRGAIEAHEEDFRKIVRNWLSGELDRAAAAELSRADRRVKSLLTQRSDVEMGILRRDENMRRRIDGGETTLDDFDEGQVVDLVRRVAAGERPAIPETLTQWLRRQKGGIHDPAGDIAEAFPEARTRPGMLRKSRKTLGNPSGGDDLDTIALRAWEDGFLGHMPERPTIRDFLDALTSDGRGEHVVRVADAGAAAKANDWDRVMRALDRIGVDFTRPMFGTSEALRDIAARVNRVLSDLDRERIGKIDASIAEAQQRGRFDFLDEADREAYLEEIVEDIFAKVTGREVDGPVRSGLAVARRGPLKERTFNIPDNLVERYIEHDAELIGRRYARIMSADIELTERFGSPDMKGPLDTVRAEYAELRRAIEADASIADALRQKRLKSLNARERADIRDIEGVRDLLRGNYRPEIQHTGWARTLSAAGLFNYMVALGGVTISSLTDAVRPAMVHGLSAYMRDGLRPLIRNMKAAKLSREEAKLAGAISDRWLASRMATLAEITDPYAANSPFERFLQNAAAGFTRMTGLLHWNDFQRGIAATMTQNRILANAELAAEKGFAALPECERAYMAFLGLGEDRADRLGALFKAHGETLDGVRVANTEAWGDDPAAAVLRRAYRAAVNKDTDSIIVSKGVGDVPLLANTPTGRALLQFKSFAIASNQRVLIRGLQEDKTRFIGGVVGMATIGAFIYMLKQIESGREISDNPGTWIAEGLDRSGIFSVAFEINGALEKVGAPGLYAGAAALFPGSSQRPPASRFAARSKVGSFFGPSFGTATDAVGLMSLGFENLRRAASGEPPALSEGDISAMRRLTPYASLPHWRWLVDGMIVREMKEATK